MRTRADLRPDQHLMINFLKTHDHAFLLAQMGAGKSVSTLTALKDTPGRILIFAPLRVCHSVWPREIEEWDFLSHLTVAVATGTPAKRRAALESDAKIVTINYENTRWFFDNFDPVALGFTTLVIDEITRLKSVRSARWKCIKKHLHKFDTRIGLTGTPTSNSLIDLFGQVYCIDEGVALGRRIVDFQRRWFEETERSKLNHYNEFVPIEGAMEDILEAISSVTFQADPEAYETLPKIDNQIMVTLPDGARRVYNDLVREYVTTLADGSVVVAETAAAVSIKLQQITAGFTYHDETATWLHDAKLDALGELLDSQQGRPTLIAYKFREELRQMREHFGGASLSGMTGDRAQMVIDRWNRGEFPHLYIHPQSAGHGLNLQQGGSTIVWYGLPWSLEHYEQTVARIHRFGQKDTVFNHCIVADGTIDERIWSTLQTRGDLKEAATSYFLDCR